MCVCKSLSIWVTQSVSHSIYESPASTGFSFQKPALPLQNTALQTGFNTVSCYQKFESYAESYFKAWNIQARLAWRVPRETHTNLVEGFLCKGYPSLRNQILSRYVNFAKTLSASPSKEIRFVFNLIKDDKGSVTARNMTHINRLCNCQTLCLSGWKVKDLLPSKNDCEAWRTSLLSTLLDAKINKSYGELNLQKQTMEDMIRSLCVS